MFDAEWEGEDGKRYVLQKRIRKNRSVYNLAIAEQFVHEPFIRYNFDTARQGARMYTAQSPETPDTTLPPIAIEQNMMTQLRTAGIEPPADTCASVIDMAFWDIVCHIIAEHPSVRTIIEDGLDPNNNTPYHVLYGMAGEAAKVVEPSLTRSLIARVINHANDSVEQEPTL